MKNTTDNIQLNARLQPIANAANPLSPQLMFKRKRSEDSVKSSERSVVLKQFHSDHRKPSPSRVFDATSVDQSMFGLRLAERSLDSKEMHINNLDATASPTFAEKSTKLKLLDLSMSDVRSAERSIELNVLHSYHSDLLASKSESFAESSANLKLLNSSISDVRSSERSIELNILHSYHSDPSALSFAEKSKTSKQINSSMSDVRPAERSIDLSMIHSYHSDPSEYLLQSSGLENSRNLMQPTSLENSTSDVRSAERSIEINELLSFHFDQSASQMHSAGLAEASTDSNVLDSAFSAQTGNYNVSISDVRSAERSLEL